MTNGGTMLAMACESFGAPLVARERALPEPGRGEVRIAISACGVCRTDLHVVDGELPAVRLPIIPGHEAIGRIDAMSPGATGLVAGQRVGVPWLWRACGQCAACRRGDENLCPEALFTGCHRDGGYATHLIADARYVVPLPEHGDDLHDAPLLCAGLIGWRSLRKAGEAATLGLYGFGAAAHLVTQLALHEGRRVFAFTRPGDRRSQQFALALGASWAGAAGDLPPEPLDAAILFAPAGELVPQALRAVRPGGRVVCAGIHMSDIPSFPYALLWGERQVVSVANLTRADALEFFPAAAHAGIEAHVREYPLAQANEALAALRAGELDGAAVLRVAPRA